MSPDPDARMSRPVASGSFLHNAHPPRRPVLGLALSFLAGVGVGLDVSVPLLVPVAIAGLFVTLSFLLRHPVGATVCLQVAVAATGWIRADLSRSSLSGARLADLLGRPAETLTVVGVILDEPAWQPSVSVSAPDDVGVWRFGLRAESVNRTGEAQPVTDRMRVRWVAQGGPASPRFGDRWRFEGVVRDASRDASPRYRSGRFSLDVAPDGAQRIDVDAGNPFIAACLRGRLACARVLERGLASAPREAGLLKALLLGYRDELPADLEETFALTGTLHIFAISGLHVGVMGAILIGILRTLGVPRYQWILLLTPLLIVYTVATGMKPSATRACVMALVYWSAPLFRRKPDAPSALAAAAILIVAARPSELFAPGFVLSFVVVAGILSLYPILYEPLRSRFQPDPWMLQAPAAPQAAGYRFGLRLGSLVALSVACWLAAAPLSAWFFSILSPVALAGNILVVPAAFLIVLTGCLSLISALLSGWIAETFNLANLFFTSMLLRVVDVMAALPMGHRYVRAPAWTTVLLWYAVLGAWVSGGRPLRWIGGVVILCLVVLWWTGPPRSGLVVNALDARGVVTLHVNGGDREHVIVDPGPAHEARRVIRYLHGQGVNRIRSVILTRAAPQVAGAAAEVLDAFPVDELWIGAGVRTDPAASNALHTATVRGIPIKTRVQRDRIALADGTDCELLWPPATEADSSPPCMRFANGMVSVLLCTTADLSAQAAFEQARVEWSASALVLSTSRVPTFLSPDWLDAVGARTVILSEKPVRRLRDEYGPLFSELRRTGRDLVLTSESGGVRIRERAPGGGPAVNPVETTTFLYE